MNNHNKYNKGFTLLEMIVSLGIFAVVAVIAVGALLKISDANRKALILKTAVNNLNFALETMSREVRLGSDYSCSPNSSSIQRNGQSTNCSNSGGWALAFASQYKGRDSVNIDQECNLTYVYFFDKSVNKIKKMQSKYCDDNINDSTKYFEILSPEVNIVDSDISLDKTNQPKAFIWLKGEVGSRESDKVGFSLQTTISQRAP